MSAPKVNHVLCPESAAAEAIDLYESEGIAIATDGCECDPDGECEHGCPSWLLKLGMI